MTVSFFKSILIDLVAPLWSLNLHVYRFTSWTNWSYMIRVFSRKLHWLITKLNLYCVSLHCIFHEVECCTCDFHQLIWSNILSSPNPFLFIAWIPSIRVSRTLSSSCIPMGQALHYQVKSRASKVRERVRNGLRAIHGK